MRRCVAAGVGVVMAAASAAWGDAKADFETVFGPEARKAAAGGPAAQAEFAKKLLEAAKGVTEDPPSQAFLLEKSLEFSRKGPAGWPCALEAIDLLLERYPAERARWLEARVDLTGRQYERAGAGDRQEAGRAYVDAAIACAEAKAAAGKTEEALSVYRKGVAAATSVRHRQGEIQDRLAALVSAGEAGEKKEKLARRLTQNPKDLQAREQLIYLCLTELDSPAQANEAIVPEVEESLRAAVAKAMKPVESLAEGDCMLLGDWYSGPLAGKASAAGKRRVQARARTYYARFLQLHAKNDLQTLKARTALQKLEAAAEGGRGHEAVDLLKLLRLEKDVVAGKWSLKNGALVSEPGWCCRVQFPYEPPAEYDYAVEFTRVSGGECVGQLLTAQGTPFTCGVGFFNNTRAGIETIRGQRLNTSPLAVSFPVANGRRYVLTVQVRKTGVRALVNGRPLVQYKTDFKDVAIPGDHQLRNPKAVGLLAHSSPVVFHSAKLIPISGPGTVVKDP